MRLAHDTTRGWAFVALALIWTAAFFVLPFVVMGAMSLSALGGRAIVWGLSHDNYTELAS